MDIRSIQKAVGLMYNEDEKNSTLGCTLLVSVVGFVNMLRELLNKLRWRSFLMLQMRTCFMLSLFLVRA